MHIILRVFIGRWFWTNYSLVASPALVIVHIVHCDLPLPGFPTGVENMGWRGGGSSKFDGGRRLESIHEGRMGGGGGLKTLLKNTCEGVHLLVKLLAISLQACKFTKNELLHTQILSYHLLCFRIPRTLIFQSTV